MKRNYVRCKACHNFIEKDANFCPQCGARNKEPFYKKWWFWVIVTMLIVSFASGGESEEPERITRDTSKRKYTESFKKTEPATEAKAVIELIAGEPGEYGELFTINKDTKFEETYYIYCIPAGTYTVTNAGEYMSQFSVYSGEVHVTDDGWEEFTESIYIKVLDVDQSDTFTIEEGQCIEIHEPAKFIIELVG